MRHRWITFSLGAALLVFGARHAAAFKPLVPHCMAMDTRLDLPLAELRERVHAGIGLEARCAAEAMLDWHPRHALAQLDRLFRTGNGDTRVQIVTALGNAPSSVPPRPLLALLLRALDDHDANAAMRTAAFQSLQGQRAYPHAAIVAALRSLQHGPSPDYVASDYLRNAARLPRWTAAPLLRLLAKSATADAADLRVDLLHALARTRDPEALTAVAHAALACGDLCTNDAFDALTEIGDDGIAPLQRIFAVAPIAQRIDVLLALKKIATSRSLAAMARLRPSVLRAIYAKLDSTAIADNDDGLRWLTRMGALAQPAFARIVVFLDSANDQLRADAADALREIELAAAIAPLRKHEHDPNAWVQREVTTALGELEWSTHASP